MVNNEWVKGINRDFFANSKDFISYLGRGKLAGRTGSEANSLIGGRK